MASTSLPGSSRHGADRRLPDRKEGAMATAVTVLALVLLLLVIDQMRR